MTDDEFDDIPDLDPEFADALREAGGQPPREPEPEATQPPPHREPEPPPLPREPDPAPPPPDPEPEPPSFVPEEPPRAEPLPPEPAPEPEPELEPEPEPAEPEPPREPAPPPPAPVSQDPPTEQQPLPPPLPPPPADPAPPPVSDPGATIEYAPGEAPDEGPPSTEQPIPGPPPVDPSLERTLIIRARDEAREAVAVAAETGEPWAPSPPPAGGDLEPPPKRKRLWLRFVLAGFLIVASFAGATTAVGVLRLNSIIEDLKPIPGIQDKLKDVQSGEPETFLILGSDRRKVQVEEGERGLSDTTILLRVDPDQNRIAVLNIPRDLKVDIPGYGVNKFNAAYSFGGPKLTLQTVKDLTRGTGLTINHLVNIDFLGFAQAINSINCVYVDVDRRYYHSNAGLAPEDQYSEINIQPGYQRLCGADGLAYVRYRHTDTDLVRAARQQDFLREARQRVPASELFKEVTGVDDDLIKTFTSHTQSDIQDAGTMVEVMKLMIGARNAPIKEIHFPATLGPSYVYASHSDIKGAIEQFLGFEASGGPRGSLDKPPPKPSGNTGASGATGATGQNGGESGQGQGKGGGQETNGNPTKAKPPPEEKAPPTPKLESDGLVDASTSGLQMAKKAARKASPDLAIYYPTRVPPGSEYDNDEVYTSNPRVYHIQDTSGDVHEAYRTVLELFAPDGTHYFGVQGIRGWSDPPAINHPSETRTIGKLDTQIFLDGDRVRMISWHDGDNTYWLANSLLQTLTNDQMLGMVRSMRKVVPNPKHRPKAKQK